MDRKDVITISVVSFHPMWGEKERNLSRILGFAEAAAHRGSDLVVFPEMALTGYDDETEVPITEKMQYRLAEREDGPSVRAISDLARELGIYVMCGLPLRDGRTTDADGTERDVIYNALACATPEGETLVYRKIHLANTEPSWGTRGSEPLIVDTPWGPIGVGICYDSYRFPELPRYYAAKGCRVYVNATALAKGYELNNKALETIAVREGIYVVTSNLCGLDRDNWFYGGSSIIGPSQHVRDARSHYYAGMPFLADGADEEALYTATIDLGLASRALFSYNPAVDGSDWRPRIYRSMLDDVLSDGTWD